MGIEDPTPSARDRVAFVIAVGLVSWGLVTLISVSFNDKPLSDKGGEIFLAIAVGLASSLTAYFATK